jgi:hypothetical protein
MALAYGQNLYDSRFTALFTGNQLLGEEDLRQNAPHGWAASIDRSKPSKVFQCVEYPENSINRNDLSTG